MTNNIKSRRFKYFFVDYHLIPKKCLHNGNYGILCLQVSNLGFNIGCRDTMEDYCMEVKKLAMGILSHMAKALKMDGEEMRELFGDGVQSIRMNYYPPCPQPERAIGFTPHSDADALTILFQLNEIEGLQIRKDGRWVPVKPLPNAFVVNIGDIMEVLRFYFDQAMNYLKFRLIGRVGNPV